MVGEWNDGGIILTTKIEVLGEKPVSNHYIHHKFHMHGPGIEIGFRGKRPATTICVDFFIVNLPAYAQDVRRSQFCKFWYW